MQYMKRGKLGTSWSECRYETVKADHSWNAKWLFTNSCMFQLPLHSDHHLHGAKPYQVILSADHAVLQQAPLQMHTVSMTDQAM